jgi:hypothetical protein
MKKIVFTLAVGIIGFLACFFSCDKIEKPYRVEEETPVALACDTPLFPAITANDVIQKYLLEDYTGHTCVNCPRAHTETANLKTKMRDTLIVVAIHAGGFAEPDPYSGSEGCTYLADYRTDVGNAYNAEFNKAGSYPAATINRMGKRLWTSVPDWRLCLDTITRKPPTIGLQVISEYNTATDTACVFVKTSLFADMNRNVRLCVLLVENKIISPQRDAMRGDLCDYEHNHLLRKALSPVWGSALAINKNGDSQIRGYAFSFAGTSWNKDNCGLIAFVYDVDSYEILQVDEIKFVQ